MTVDLAAIAEFDPEAAELAGFTVTVKDIPSITTLAELRALVGISDNRARDFADRGVFVKTGRNRFDTRRSLSRAFAEISQAVKRGLADDIDREKLRVQRETADKLAAQNALARGELVAAGEVERRWTTVLTDVRSRLLAVPSRVGARASHFTAADLDMIDREIRDTLKEVADGDA